MRKNNFEAYEFYNRIEDEIGLINSRTSITMMQTAFGCHYLNLVQKHGMPLVVNNTKPVDMRKHPMFVSPPGFGKSTKLKIFYSCIPDEMKSGEHPEARFVNHITEAGFSGTVTSYNGNKLETAGIAQECEKGFLIIEEFSAILESFNQSHSSTFEQTLLMALDDGKVSKSLANGTKNFETNLTLACGIQPIKVIGASSGLLRRFVTEFNLPDLKSIKEVRDSARNTWKNESFERSNQVIVDMQRYIRDNVDNKLCSSYIIKDEVFDFLDSFENLGPGIESDIYMQSIFGYNYFIDNVEDDVLIVDVDDYIKNMVKVDYESRKLLSFDLHSLLVLIIIKNLEDSGQLKQSGFKMTEVVLHANCYQMTFQEIHQAFRTLETIGLISRIDKGLDTYKINTSNAFINTIIHGVNTIQATMKGKTIEDIKKSNLAAVSD